MRCATRIMPVGVISLSYCPQRNAGVELATHSQFEVIFAYVWITSKPHSFLLILQYTDRRVLTRPWLKVKGEVSIHQGSMSWKSNLLLLLFTFALRTFSSPVSYMAISFTDEIFLWSPHSKTWLVKLAPPKIMTSSGLMVSHGNASGTYGRVGNIFGFVPSPKYE